MNRSANDKLTSLAVRRLRLLAMALAGASMLVMNAEASPANAAAAGAPMRGMVDSAFREAGAVVQPAVTSAPVSFEVFLPLRNTGELDALLEAQQAPTSPQYHRWLTPAEFSARFGPTRASMQRVSAALAGAGLQVAAVRSRSLQVSGTVASVNRAFGVSLQRVTRADGVSRLAAPAELALPAALSAEGAVVIAFNGLPPAHRPLERAPVTPANRNSSHGNYYFTDIRQAYDFPAINVANLNGHILDGTGVKIAIVMDSDAYESDVAAEFEHEYWRDVTGKAVPTFNHVALNGGAGLTGGGLMEASNDVQQVLGGAPGADVTLIDTPSLDYDQLAAAYIDIDEDNTYDIVSSSIVGCELYFTAPYNSGTDRTGIPKVFSELFKQGTSQGITFMVSSGDNGGLECPDTNYGTGRPSKFIPSVSFPADSPYVTAVGGGNLITTPPPSPQTKPETLTSRYVSENANGDPEIPYDPENEGQTVSGGYWAAGGGLSAIFPRPAYQEKVDTGSQTRRAMPDVAMQVGGCPTAKAKTPCGPDRSAAVVYVKGSPSGIIGTSVSAPEFAAAAALYVELHGRQGNLNPYLYAEAAHETAEGGLKLHTGQPGFDGYYTDAMPGGVYDYTFGNGSPRVRRLFRFYDVPAAGDPQTPSNP